MLNKILALLSYGKKIERYALSAQVIAKALNQLHLDLQEIWKNGSEPKTVTEVVKKVDSANKIYDKGEKPKKEKKDAKE